MLDLAYILLIALFFTLMFAYVRACVALGRSGSTGSEP